MADNIQQIIPQNNERLIELIKNPAFATAMQKAVDQVIREEKNAANRPRLCLNLLTIINLTMIAVAYFTLYVTKFGGITPGMKKEAVNDLYHRDLMKARDEAEARKLSSMKQLGTEQKIVAPSTIGSLFNKIPGFGYFFSDPPKLDTPITSVGASFPITNTPDYFKAYEEITLQFEPYAKMKNNLYTFGNTSKTFEDWHIALTTGAKYKNTKLGIIYQIIYKIITILFAPLKGEMPSYLEVSLLCSFLYSLNAWWVWIVGGAGVGSVAVSGFLYITREYILYPTMNIYLSLLSIILLSDNNFAVEVGDNVDEDEQPQPQPQPGVEEPAQREVYADYLLRVLNTLNLYKPPGEEVVEPVEDEDPDINALVANFRGIVLNGIPINNDVRVDIPQREGTAFLNRMTHFLNYMRRVVHPNRGGAKKAKRNKPKTKRSRRTKKRSGKGKKRSRKTKRLRKKI